MQKKLFLIDSSLRERELKNSFIPNEHSPSISTIWLIWKGKNDIFRVNTDDWFQCGVFLNKDLVCTIFYYQDWFQEIIAHLTNLHQFKQQYFYWRNIHLELYDKTDYIVSHTIIQAYIEYCRIRQLEGVGLCRDPIESCWIASPWDDLGYSMLLDCGALMHVRLLMVVQCHSFQTSDESSQLVSDRDQPTVQHWNIHLLGECELRFSSN